MEVTVEMSIDYNLYMYNVGFGDAFLLKGDDYSAILDCGSVSAKNIGIDLSVVVNDMRKHFVKDNNYLVVSHFHEDHYKGVKFLQKDEIDKIVVPNFFSKSNIKMSLYALRLFSKKSAAYYFAYNLLTMLPNLINNHIIKDGGSVEFVSAGENILDGRFRVVWPDRKKYYELINSCLDEIESSVEYNDSDELFSSILNNYVILIGIIQEEGGLILYKNEQMLVITDRLETQIREFARTNNKIKTHNFDDIKKKIKNKQNENCLVIEGNGANGEKDLFLGDISKNKYLKEIKPFIEKNEYRCIKVSHHGTKNYFVDCLPESEKLLISNGEHRTWYLCKDYSEKYKSRDIICTGHDGCESYNSNNKSCACYAKSNPQKVCGIPKNSSKMIN